MTKKEPPNYGTINSGAELTAYVELMANFFERYGRDPKPGPTIVADARMLAAGDGPVSAIN